MTPKYLEWIKQADYDMETADFMFNGKRFFYAVFMAHLAVEKALKGLYQKKLHETPPKTHNLIYLMGKIGLKPDEKIGRFIAKLNEANIAARYPENLEKVQQVYTQEVTCQILSQAKDVIAWIKKQY